MVYKDVARRKERAENGECEECIGSNVKYKYEKLNKVFDEPARYGCSQNMMGNSQIFAEMCRLLFSSERYRVKSALITVNSPERLSANFTSTTEAGISPTSIKH